MRPFWLIALLSILSAPMASAAESLRDTRQVDIAPATGEPVPSRGRGRTATIPRTVTIPPTVSPAPGVPGLRPLTGPVLNGPLLNGGGLVPLPDPATPAPDTTLGLGFSPSDDGLPPLLDAAGDTDFAGMIRFRKALP